MEIRYTSYAEIRITKRKISKNLIEDIMKNPEQIVEGQKRRKIAQRIVGKYIFRVVFEEDGNIFKVITAYYSKPERYV